MKHSATNNTLTIFLPLGLVLLLISCKVIAQDSPSFLSGTSQPKVLPAEKAFTVFSSTQGDEVKLDWLIAPACYLYKERFFFKAITSKGERPLRGKFQAAKLKYDPYFEKEVDVFYESTQVTLSIAGLPRPFKLEIKSQGCAEAGVCYPPRTQTIEIPASN